MPVKKEKQFTMGGNPVIVKPDSREGCVELTAGPYECKVSVGLDKKIVFSVRKGINSLNDTEWFAEGYNGGFSFRATKLTSYGRTFNSAVVLKDGLPYPQFLNPYLPSFWYTVEELRRRGVSLDDNGCMGMKKTLAVLTAIERKQIRFPTRLGHDPNVSQLEEKLRLAIKYRNSLEEAAMLGVDVEKIKEKQPEVVAFIRKSTMPSPI